MSRFESGKFLSSPLATRPSGLTLVEMLVAMAITLIMMAAVVNLFANVGASVRNRRATIEMSGQLRMVRLRLYNDLVGATCPTLTWQRPGDNNGYLEIVEGQWSDKNPSGLMDGVDDGPGTGFRNRELDYATSLVPSGGDPLIIIPPASTREVDPNDVTNGGGLGDYDDILALTVRSEGEQFVGRGLVRDPTANSGAGGWRPGTIESTLAEVIWYAVENPVDGLLGEPGMRTVYRRVLLIAPWVNLATISTGGPPNAQRYKNFYDRYDISARIEELSPGTGNYEWVPNTLGDLTKRENRFAHFGVPPKAGIYPWALDDRRIRHLISIDHPLNPLSGDRMGEDVMLSDVLAFDVRVYDPGAPLRREPAPPSSGPDVPYTALEPCDSGWVRPNAPLDVIGYGTYVDIGWSHRYTSFPNSSQALFADRRQVGWHPSQPNILTDYPAVYDTWSFHYENDGLDQDNRDGDNSVNTGADEGTNGLDDDNLNGVDDMGERETAPPYDVPLRGLQVKLRVYEPDTRNIRETTVTRNFVP